MAGAEGGCRDGACQCNGGLVRPCSHPSECASTEVCAPNGCGQVACVRRGRRCITSSDCGEGSACIAAPGGGPAVCRYEVSGADTCADERDCPLGSVCEGDGELRRCVARRLPCEESTTCPAGMICERGVVGEAPACRWIARRCADDRVCGGTAGDACRDLTGDGHLECGETATDGCASNASCPASAGCSPYTGRCEEGERLCNEDAHCPSGSCFAIDPGQPGLCVTASGACQTHADCPAGARCAVPRGGRVPECVVDAGGSGNAFEDAGGVR